MKTIGIVSDLHCGSAWALLPKSYWSDRTPEAVRWLWQCWQWLIKHWPDLDLLVLNGDLIDGKQFRSRGTGLVTTSLGEQTDMAIECLAPLADKAKKVIRLEGTAYHESFEGPLGKLDTAFGIKVPKHPHQRHVRDIRLSKEAVLNVKHKPEGEGMLYRGTGLDRELLWATVMEVMSGIPHATHIVRSHLHSKAGPFEGFGKVIVGTPGWCLQTPYALQKKRYRWIPDVGATLLVKDEFAHCGYRITSKVFPVEQEEAEIYATL